MIKRVSIMLRRGDEAHASIALTPERTYYRFATDDSIEDGELAPVADFSRVADDIASAALPGEGEEPLPGHLRMQVFVDNVLLKEKPSRRALLRVVDILQPLAPEFAFLSIFC